MRPLTRDGETRTLPLYEERLTSEDTSTHVLGRLLQEVTLTGDERID